MPSDHLLLYFAHPLKLINHWAVNGVHYSKTLEVCMCISVYLCVCVCVFVRVKASARCPKPETRNPKPETLARDP